MMTLKTLFEREVFVRVGEDRSTLICTTKWRFLSVCRRFGIGKADLVPALEKSWTHQATECKQSDEIESEIEIWRSPEKRFAP